MARWARLGRRNRATLCGSVTTASRRMRPPQRWQVSTSTANVPDPTLSSEESCLSGGISIISRRLLASACSFKSMSFCIVSSSVIVILSAVVAGAAHVLVLAHEFTLVCLQSARSSARLRARHASRAHRIGARALASGALVPVRRRLSPPGPGRWPHRRLPRSATPLRRRSGRRLPPLARATPVRSAYRRLERAGYRVLRLAAALVLANLPAAMAPSAPSCKPTPSPLAWLSTWLTPGQLALQRRAPHEGSSSSSQLSSARQPPQNGDDALQQRDRWFRVLPGKVPPRRCNA